MPIHSLLFVFRRRGTELDRTTGTQLYDRMSPVHHRQFRAAEKQKGEGVGCGPFYKQATPTAYGVWHRTPKRQESRVATPKRTLLPKAKSQDSEEPICCG